MDVISRDQLQALSEQHRRFCVSIFLPTHPYGPEIRQDPVRLKNLLRQAEAEMLAVKMRPSRIRQMLNGARQLAERQPFWRKQDSGLALYIAPGFFRYFRLPLVFPERVSVLERFEIKPLVPLFTASEKFYVLAISRHSARLFAGTQAGLGEIPLINSPQGIEDSLKYDVHERQQQAHSGTGMPGARGRKGAVFHGQNVGADDAKERILVYFRQIDRALRGLMRSNTWAPPLLLAGVEELFPLFREASTYPRLLEQRILGNPDLTTSAELHKSAVEVLRPFFEESREKALAEYNSLAGSARSTGNAAEALAAAHEGKIEFALIRPDAELWGRFHPATAAVEIHETAQPGDEDLVNATAIQTVLHRGAIYAVDQIPGRDGSPVAAVYRYPDPERRPS